MFRVLLCFVPFSWILAFLTYACCSFLLKSILVFHALCDNVLFCLSHYRWLSSLGDPRVQVHWGGGGVLFGFFMRVSCSVFVENRNSENFFSYDFSSLARRPETSAPVNPTPWHPPPKGLGKCTIELHNNVFSYWNQPTPLLGLTNLGRPN